MMNVYFLVNEQLQRGEAAALSRAALWVDLLDPTPEEQRAVEGLFGIEVPSREAMQEIEASSRLYRSEGAIYATAPILTNSDSAHPENAAVTFILTRGTTVTVRYATPRPFETYAGRVTRQRGLAPTADAVLAGLLETIIDRLADVLERIGAELDALSRDIFSTQASVTARPRRDFHGILLRIGRDGDLSSKAQDSLLGVGRIVTFLSQPDEGLTRKEARQRIKTMARDTRSLSEHAAFLSGKINFLLDATLGMVNIEQNSIIKIFSVVAVVFLPPTLIASIYGMNFRLMPELGWAAGYPFALALMVLSAILPYLFFKRRGWL